MTAGSVAGAVAKSIVMWQGLVISVAGVATAAHRRHQQHGATTKSEKMKRNQHR